MKCRRNRGVCSFRHMSAKMTSRTQNAHGQPRPWILRPTAVISPEEGPTRLPPRHPGMQERGYLDAFDHSTIFYDAFRVGRRVLAVGPPAGSLVESVRSLSVIDSRGTSTQFRVEEGLDRLGRFWAKTPRRIRPTDLSISGPFLASNPHVGDNLSDRFKGRRVVMTLSKDNELEWIEAWGRWHVTRHGADALVVYDNGSSRYTLDDLWNVLAGVRGVEVALVVDWPFKYGPIALPPARRWDSNYAQHGALEHARWRLLGQAGGFLNADVDELVMDPDGKSIFELTSTKPAGAVCIEGKWAYPGPGTHWGKLPRHEDAIWVRTEGEGRSCAPKWCVIPSRLPRQAQLTVHHVAGVPSAKSANLAFWHLHNISTNWDERRDYLVIDRATHEVDEQLSQRHAGLEFPSAARVGRPSLVAQVAYLPKRVRLWLSNQRKSLSRLTRPLRGRVARRGA